MSKAKFLILITLTTNLTIAANSKKLGVFKNIESKALDKDCPCKSKCLSGGICYVTNHSLTGYISPGCKKYLNKEVMKSSNRRWYRKCYFADLKKLAKKIKEKLTPLHRMSQELEGKLGETSRTFLPFQNTSEEKNLLKEIKEAFDLKKGRLIGKGGFGKIFIIKLSNGKEYAIKQMIDHNKLLDLAEEIASFHYAQKHPNIIPYFGSFKDKYGVWNIVLEKATDNLRDYLKKKYHSYSLGRSSESDPFIIQGVSNPKWILAKLAKDIAEGVSHLHSKDLAYGDLKPINILIIESKEGIPTAKLTDFGSMVSDKQKHVNFLRTDLYHNPDESFLYWNFYDIFKNKTQSEIASLTKQDVIRYFNRFELRVVDKYFNKAADYLMEVIDNSSYQKDPWTEDQGWQKIAYDFFSRFERKSTDLYALRVTILMMYQYFNLNLPPYYAQIVSQRNPLKRQKIAPVKEIIIQNFKGTPKTTEIPKYIKKRRKNISRIFMKSRSHSIDGNVYKIINGKKMYYDLSDRIYSHSKIFNDPRIQDIPPGQYNYTLTKDGALTLGKVENEWEFGVKHYHLANGREVLVAGELVKHYLQPGSKKITFNLKSGTFTWYLIKKLITKKKQQQVIEADYQAKVEDFFSEEGFEVQYTTDTLLPVTNPYLLERLRLCDSEVFTLNNKAFCP